MDEKKIANFMFEMGQLKRVKRSGWWLLGMKDQESVADHSFRAGVLGYMLGKMEGVNAERVAFAALINDIQEARLNDLHKVGHMYIDFKTAETKAVTDQLMGLPTEIGEGMLDIFKEFHSDSSREGIVARDADLLECAIQAREYMVQGFPDAQNWINNVENLLKTDSARKVFTVIKEAEPNQWWHSLKKVER